MSETQPESSRTLRLSEAIARLRAAGVGEVDVLSLIAKAGMRGRIYATGFHSVWAGRKHTADPARRYRVDRRMWRVFCSPKADAAGYERFARDEALIWTLDSADPYLQEQFDIVMFDRLSFDIWWNEIADHYRPRELSQEEIEGWIRDYPGSNYKIAWADFQRHFGAGACKRDERFMPAWRKVRGNPQRGQPKKSPAPSPA